MSILMSAYGCEAGNTAIKWIPTGGLFVTGGLTPKNIEFIEGLHSDFMVSYLNKGRVSPLLQRVPLFAVMTEDLGVRGAHKAALIEYEKYTKEGGTRTAISNVLGFLKENAVMLAAVGGVGFVTGTLLNKRK
jgi:glucokinase